jgi:hypothetical protein
VAPSVSNGPSPVLLVDSSANFLKWAGLVTLPNALKRPSVLIRGAVNIFEWSQRLFLVVWTTVLSGPSTALGGAAESRKFERNVL